ncbi:MAG: glycerol-3-phosphate acyltransferase [Clostridia bacterium]|nr:glycerol-3-phosphate acyltransferase [Clostridia bacterium]
MNIYYILIFIVVYAICMFNPAITICKKKTGADIRRTGNMDAGIVNAFKVLGRPLGTLVIIMNVLKIILSYYIAKSLGVMFGINVASSLFESIVILATMIGHCFPAIYKFNGGKGIIEFWTLMTIFNPKYVAICVATGLMVVAFTKVIAKGNLAGCILYLVISIIMGCSYIYALIISLCIVFYRHRDNIHRMRNKQEETI